MAPEAAFDSVYVTLAPLKESSCGSCCMPRPLCGDDSGKTHSSIYRLYLSSGMLRCYDMLLLLLSAAFIVMFFYALTFGLVWSNGS